LDEREINVIDRSHIEANRVELERLRALVSRLSDDDLARPIGAGWTVAAALAHVALWDGRALYYMDRWEQGQQPSADDWEPIDIEWVNEATKPLCLALPPRAAAELALQLAEQADRRVAALPDDLLAAVIAVGPPFDLARANHRREHLDDIERGL
jgi:hypothetical protein